MIHAFDGVSIRGVAAAVPRRVREMETLLAAVPNRTKIIRSTGVERVRVTDDDTTAADLCRHAAVQLLSDLTLEPADFDALVFASITPDKMGNTSSSLQSKLGLPSMTACFDLASGCTGYVLGLLQAAVLIASGASRRVLVLVGQTPTKNVREDDAITAPLFGDAGSATVVEASPGSSLILSAHSDGASEKGMFGGVHRGYRKTGSDELFMTMDGLKVFEFSVREVPPAVRELLAAARLTTEDLDWCVFHQANKMILDFITKKLSLDERRVAFAMTDFGNTGSASIPLALVADRRIRDSARSRVLLCGFGNGLAWGGAVADLSRTHIASLVEV